MCQDRSFLCRFCSSPFGGFERDPLQQNVAYSSILIPIKCQLALHWRKSPQTPKWNRHHAWNEKPRAAKTTFPIKTPHLERARVNGIERKRAHCLPPPTFPKLATKLKRKYHPQNEQCSRYAELQRILAFLGTSG